MQWLSATGKGGVNPARPACERPGEIWQRSLPESDLWSLT